MSVTGAIMAGVGLAGSVGGAAISSNAAGNAASTQANAANNAAQLQYQASQNALGFQEQQWNQEQQNLAPWLNSGSGALSNLDYMMGVSPSSPSSFTSVPTSGDTAGTTAAFPGTTSANALQTIQQNNGGMPTQQANSLTSGANGNSGAMLAGSQLRTPTGPSSTTPTTPVSNGVSNPGLQAIQQGNGAIPTQQANSSSPTSGAILSAPGATAINTPAATPSASPASSGTSAAGGYGSLMQPYSGTFSAPSAADMAQNDPGYQARLELGTDALQRSAAASGGVVTGGTAQALNQYAQDYASNEYNNYYNQAYNTYATNYNQYNQNQTNQFNRLSALAGGGQTAASQLGTLGQSAANSASSNLLGTASNMGQDYQNAAAANASGYVGSANAYSGALNGTANNISQLALMQQLFGGGSSASVQPYSYVNGSSDPLGLGGAS